MPEHESQGAQHRFLTFLESKGLRLTSVRKAIIEAVFATRRHFTAEELLESARERNSKVSRATVYRTLPLLCESGLVREVDFGKDSKVYDPNYAEHPKHSHLICQDCQKVIEFESPKLAELEAEVQQRFGLTVETLRLEISARCDTLRRSGSCPNQSRSRRKG